MNCNKLKGLTHFNFSQHNLTYGDLKEYLVNGADGKGGRIDLIDANREGLYSCIGFLSIYIMGVQLGKIVMKKRFVFYNVKCFHFTGRS